MPYGATLKSTIFFWKKKEYVGEWSKEEKREERRKGDRFIYEKRKTE